MVAYRQSRVAVFDPASGLVALATLGEVVGALGAAAPSGHDVKALYRYGDAHGVDLAEPSDDTAIMAFLVDANSGRYELADVAQRFFGETLDLVDPVALRRGRR